jgi:hypothetical protein
MRSALATNWEARWDTFARENPEDARACKHIVILPNYKEDESTLSDTLGNLARFVHAREQMHVVLAMEASEGSNGHHKAQRLIAAHKHCFANIFATFHPENVPGETAGESANCQWALCQMQREYGPKFGAFSDKVFLTVGNADSLWHPDYFLALALDGLAMSQEERSWSMWQSPVLRLRNCSTVPGPIRVSSYATSCLELAKLAGQKFVGTNITYSAYSLSLALANHAVVDSWDTDVIAEDSRMFCKCLFDSIRLSSTAVKLNSMYLPVVSDMDNFQDKTSTGWLDSCHARFQQACRHAQGVAAAPTLHAFGMMLLSHLAVMKVIGMLCRGEFWTWYSTTLPQILSEGPSSFPEWCGAFIVGASVVPLSTMAYTTYQVVKDSIEGRLLPPLENKKDAGSSEKPMILDELRKTALAALIVFDYAVLGEAMVLIYGLIPEVLSLARFGNKKQN